jgi:triosephosphate isomerase
MPRKLVVGNWKMHTTASQASRLARAIVAGMGPEDRVTVVVCPPFPYLALVGKILEGSRVALGAQNLYPEAEGAFTGEVSPTMLLDLGCRYVIVGHSERREKLGESDAFINRKIQVALSTKLEVILCVGETEKERETGQTAATLDRQLELGLAGLPADRLSRLSIAYEPLWAIGHLGHHATPEQAESAHAMIRDRYERLFGQASARALVISYGGSVKPDNAEALMSRDGVDGALVGGASLDPEQFLAIVRAGAASVGPDPSSTPALFTTGARK